MSALYELVEIIDAAIALANKSAAELPNDREVDESICDLMRARASLVAVEGRMVSGQMVGAA